MMTGGGGDLAEEIEDLDSEAMTDPGSKRHNRASQTSLFGQVAVEISF